MNSLRKLANLPGDYEVYPGHMESTTLEAERRFNPYMRQAMGY
jgi:glyoxylase-like metal-dependent hydrolase (beta-lactamase superfamily II)